ncbi:MULTISPECIES: (2Fe-2S)-binding protein [unclassified Pseudovibrio]|uniref:(2Fe-2S)-binding protein n=1 Tax=unclassified Pseudovibrio TaxID=2627060 RepID=UPI00070AFC6A|nr:MULTISPECIES: (2Fe-2S)-binding protein [unclassified Pseudovibrio]KZL03598.1 Hydrogen cyanide synthase subunit HcnA [Pseudovibrio sp. W74]KZL09688.1 Hydrogen cyanide synthase subunit HcnA [Pseudovibrio sp. Ad14]
MFRSLRKPETQSVSININGQMVQVAEGSSLWAAMALHGETQTRLASVSGQPRSAYCAMGVCFECLVEVNGVPNQQACLTTVEEGMHVCSQDLTEQSIAALHQKESADHE